jgi:hypothetical protein
MLSIRAYARHRAAKGLTGGAHQVVRVAIARGRLSASLTPDRRQIADADAADAEWAANTTIGPRKLDATVALEREIIASLDDERWLRPMDVGGRDGTRHSEILRDLWRRGLVERRKLHALDCLVYSSGRLDDECRCKGACRFRRSAAGREALIVGA